MRSLRLVRYTAPLLIGALALSACGSKKESGAGASSDKVVKIGMIAPLTGSLSALGLGMKNSADLAINQANKNGTVKGWKIQFDPQDDQEDPNTGGAAASKLASDNQVAAVIGTLQSSIALQAAPQLNKQSIVLISPANTNPSLTQGQTYLTTKKRPFASYFRVATTDLIQGAFAADYAASTLKAKKVYLVNDKLVYGQGLCQAFGTEFKKKGGTVVGTDFVTKDQKEFGSLVSKVKAAKPDLVFYGGQFPEGAPFAKQLSDGGVKVPFMGGDGLVDKSFVATLGTPTANSYATNVGAAVEDLPSAATYVSDYKAAGYKDAFSAYGPNTYDAAQVLIAALAKVLPGKTTIDDSVRAEIVQAVQATQLDGATGKVSFDEFGDTTNKVITMYKVESGEFKKKETGTFAG
ncbi:MAG: branched chain amino acid transporter substrate-binding protein [Frankiales bacterium]|nr:branched chain amino acid transporter substrate-binding protein [Frankiales bacterium]